MSGRIIGSRSHATHVSYAPGSKVFLVTVNFYRVQKNIASNQSARYHRDRRNVSCATRAVPPDICRTRTQETAFLQLSHSQSLAYSDTLLQWLQLSSQQGLQHKPDDDGAKSDDRAHAPSRRRRARARVDLRHPARRLVFGVCAREQSVEICEVNRWRWRLACMIAACVAMSGRRCRGCVDGVAAPQAAAVSSSGSQVVGGRDGGGAPSMETKSKSSRPGGLKTLMNCVTLLSYVCFGSSSVSPHW